MNSGAQYVGLFVATMGGINNATAVKHARLLIAPITGFATTFRYVSGSSTAQELGLRITLFVRYYVHLS
jgi:hypothetical protein